MRAREQGPISTTTHKLKEENDFRFKSEKVESIKYC